MHTTHIQDPLTGDVDHRSTPTRRLRRRVAVVGLAVAMIATLTACDPGVWPVTKANLNAADAAGAWIAADYQANGSGYTAGDLADVVLSLASLNSQRDVAEAALNDLAVKAPAYVNPGGGSVVNAGGTAKVMLAVQALRHDPNDFAGLDLEAMLRSTLVTSGTDEGRLGTSTGFTQALGILALSRTPGRSPASSGAWLAARQCPDGGFSSGSCTFESPDATGLALSALVFVSPTTHATAITAARDYLLGRQLSDGGWGAGNSDTVSNANSTGFAAQGLRSVGYATEAEQGATFIRSLQYDASSGAKAGAIRWRAGTDGNLKMATIQGVLAFGAGSYAEVFFPKIIGDACVGDAGVTEVVDLASFDNTIRISCAQGPQESGWAVLVNSGFDVGSVPGLEGSAVCTINSFPTAGYPTCWQEGFWSYWLWNDNTSAWEFSNEGAANRVPELGSVEGWRYEPDLYNHFAVAPGIGDPRLPVVVPE